MELVIGHPRIAPIVFVGPFGVGKTTAVHTLSNVRVITTEARSTPMAQLDDQGETFGKVATTVALDYGEWVTEEGQRVSLIGTPGQSRFSAMRRSAMVTKVGIVLWLFGDRAGAIDEMRAWIDQLDGETELNNLVVAVTRYDDEVGPPISAYEDFLDERLPSAPIVLADPRAKDDVARVVTTVLAGGRKREEFAS